MELSEKIDNLYMAHIGRNNFYNEPAHARILDSYVSSTGVVPDPVRKKYVKTVVMAKIGNGHGISVMSEQYYDNMLIKFGDDEIKEFVCLLSDSEFSSRVCLNPCNQGFKNLADFFWDRTTNQISLQAIGFIQQATNQQLPNLGKDSRYQAILSSFS
ncbi:hypothetical protein [Photobacterium sp. 53610]|uniref:hypothetical protein n=1 Tax=Photobacterium sp. 53610 TaxID=3102789 RepID=UPI002EDADB2F